MFELNQFTQKQQDRTTQTRSSNNLESFAPKVLAISTKLNTESSVFKEDLNFDQHQGKYRLLRLAGINDGIRKLELIL